MTLLLWVAVVCALGLAVYTWREAVDLCDRLDREVLRAEANRRADMLSVGARLVDLENEDWRGVPGLDAPVKAKPRRRKAR